MTDSTLTVTIDADTSGLLSGLITVKDALNDTFGTAKLKAEEARTPVAGLFKAMESASDKAVAGLIRGTETWQKAMTSIIQDVEIKFVQLGIHKLVNWVETELGMTQATDTGNAARTASDQAASDSGIAAQAQKAIASLSNDAKEVFGGIFAFLSPEMGPAAAGPAAAGSASVTALASGITYAESGAWEIPSDTLAYLHSGEMVVPQPFAASLRDGSGFGGGDSYTININAIDTQTGAQFLKNNAAVIASTLSGQARNFNRNLPVWKS